MGELQKCYSSHRILNMFDSPRCLEMVALLSLVVMSVEAVTLWKAEGWLWITKPLSWTRSLPAPFQGPVLGSTTPTLTLTPLTPMTRLPWRRQCSMMTWISFGMVCISSPLTLQAARCLLACLCMGSVLRYVPARACVVYYIASELSLVWNILCSHVPAEPHLWLLRKNIVLWFWFLSAWDFLQTTPLSIHMRL